MQAIRARNLSKTYWFYEKEVGFWGAAKSLFRSRKVYVDAVHMVSLDVDVGELLGFIGPNGAGKTTTLKMLSGILHPTAGELDVMGYVPWQREKAFLNNIALVTGQRDRLFWDLPAQEYFEFCRVVYEIPQEIYQKNLRELIQLAEIGDILKIPQRKLSFGQRKLCELVAALLHGPKVIFLDEPTNALDLINARKIREFIRNMANEGRCTIILTSHNMADIEQVCDRLVIINQGNIVFDGGIEALNRMDGLKKQMRVVFKGHWAADKLAELAQIMQINGQEVVLEVEPEKAASVATHLFADYAVKDVVITDPPLEKIIESIYTLPRIK